MHPSSSNKYLSPELVEKKDNSKEHSFSKHFEILLHEHNNELISINNDKNKQYYDNFLLALKSENNEKSTKAKKITRKVNRKSVQLDASTMSLMKLKNLKLNNPSSPRNNHNKKTAINNINIYITKNKDDKPNSVYSSVKSNEDESKKLIVKKKKNNVYYSTFNSKNTINTEKKSVAVNEVKKKKKLFCCIPIC